jgi:hypothetical protein
MNFVVINFVIEPEQDTYCRCTGQKSDPTEFSHSKGQLAVCPNLT